MPAQTTTSNLFQLLQQQYGAAVAEANEAHKDAPVDVGFQRLPAGIDGGIAKLQVMTLGQYKDDKMGPNMKGKLFFRAAAVVVHPKVFNGVKIENRQTSIMFPLCDVPAKGQKKATSFKDNFFAFQNLFKLLGEKPSRETRATDPTGMKAILYYQALMQKLTDPKRPPVFINFSTRGWTPPPPPGSPPGTKVQEMVFESWHGLADMSVLNGADTFDPSAGVTEAHPPVDVPLPTDEMPDGPTDSAQEPLGPEEEVAYLVEIANADPEGQTDEGAAALTRLQEMAWANGWTEEQTAAADGWDAVGEMALGPPSDQDNPNTESPVTIGSKWKFAKRGRDGNKLKKPNGDEFPAVDVEVTSVDLEAGTCTLKTVKDGKDVVNIGSKKPLAVKFEWLE